MEYDYPQCNPENNIKAVYLLKATDLVWLENMTVRMKRKYGKNKRNVVKIEQTK